MGSQRYLQGANIPDMQVMNFSNTRGLFHCLCNTGKLNTLGDTFNQDMDRTSQYPISTDQDQQTNQHTGYRIDPLPTGFHDDDGCQYNAHGCHRIPQDVQECTSNIQVVSFMRFMLITMRMHAA